MGVWKRYVLNAITGVAENADPLICLMTQNFCPKPDSSIPSFLVFPDLTGPLISEGVRLKSTTDDSNGINAVIELECQDGYRPL